MQRAAQAHAIFLTFGDFLSSSPGLDSAVFFALQWVAACLLSALLSWGLIVFVFQRRHHLRATHRGILYVALLLLTFAGSILVNEGRAFAFRAPLFCALVQILFLLYFALCSDERYVPRWTRWLLIIMTFALLVPYWPQKPSPSLAFLPFFQVPGLLGLLAALGNLFAVLLIVVSIVPQIYYRYRDFVLTGEHRPIQQRTGLLSSGALALASFLVFIAEAELAPASQTPAPELLSAETGFALLLVLMPAAASFTVLHQRPYDREAFLDRLLVYSLLTLSLLLIYAGSILALWVIFPGFAALPPFVDLPFLISIALLLALAFRPLQAQIQERVNRRFSRRMYSAARHINAFTATLREDTPLDELSTRLLAALQQSLLPASAVLWLQTLSAPMTGRAPGSRSTTNSYELARWNPAPAEIRLHRQAETAPAPDQTAPAALTVASDDPARPALLRPASIIEIDRQPSSSAVMRLLRAAQVALAVPFVSQGELVGVLALGPRLPEVPARRYTFDDCEQLARLAEQLAPVLRQLQHAHAQELEERARERVEQELQTARRIQEALLPKAVPLLDGWQMATYYQPAREVGGDFYDFLPLADGRLGMVLGDVTDKGIPAALVMATTRSMLRAVAVQPAISPGQVLAQVNELLALDLPVNMFVTCFYAILDPATGRLLYANAGQDLPYLRHADGTVEELRARGMPLGLMPGMPYEEQETTLLPGDRLLFYSDGLVEAHNPKREMFGFPRLMALLGKLAEESSLILFLLQELATFTGSDWEQEDDLTLVVLQRAADASLR